jgi:ribonuclease P protein subunit POP4
MTISPENILYHELVGLQVIIQESSDISLKGLSGKIVSETRNMITVEKKDGNVSRVAKEIATKIELATDSGVCFISGSSLIGKPEDRLARLH